jgi:hypothetical protein
MRMISRMMARRRLKPMVLGLVEIRFGAGTAPLVRGRASSKPEPPPPSSSGPSASPSTSDVRVAVGTAVGDETWVGVVVAGSGGVAVGAPADPPEPGVPGVAVGAAG